MQDPQKRVVVVLTAAMPEPGRVKARLGADIGCEAAAQLYRAFVEDLVERLQVSWPLVLGGDCDWPMAAYDHWLPGLHAVWAQGAGDWGARAERLMGRAFAEQWAGVVLIGSDVPHLASTCIDDALARLDAGADIVLGPSDDGACYLVAMRRLWAIFDTDGDATMGPLEAMSRRAVALGAKVVLLATETNLDDGRDLDQVARRMARGEFDSIAMPRTRELVPRLEWFPT